MMRDLDIARWRLRSQHLVWPCAVSAREAAGSLLAVQGENPGQAAWAVVSRTSNPDQAELAAPLGEGTVVRTHVPRPTWHFVPAEEAGWLLDLTGPQVRQVTGQQLRNAHGLDERAIGHAVTAVMEALASRGQLTRAQLANELRDHPFPAMKFAWPHLTRQPGGRIMVTASTVSLEGAPYKAAYVAAKHAVLGLVKVAALEGAPGLHLRGIFRPPGGVQTR